MSWAPQAQASSKLQRLELDQFIYIYNLYIILASRNPKQIKHGNCSELLNQFCFDVFRAGGPRHAGGFNTIGDYHLSSHKNIIKLIQDWSRVA